MGPDIYNLENGTKGELIALIFFLQYYKYYLLHRPFLLRTDNRALTWIRSLESPTGMILRWLDILSSFDFTVRHRKGTLHGNADSLSRAPHSALPTSAEEKILVSDEGVVITNNAMSTCKTSRNGRMSCQLRQRNSFCLPISVSCLPSHLRFNRMLPLHLARPSPSSHRSGSSVLGTRRNYSNRPFLSEESFHASAGPGGPSSCPTLSSMPN